MNIRDRKGLEAAATQALSCVANHRRLVLIYAVVAGLLPLLTGLISFLLDSRIAQTGGLAGIGVRSTLSTVQTLLATTVSWLLPFWSMGYVYTTLRFSHGQETGAQSLLEGFRRFGPVLRLLLLKELLFAGLGVLCIYFGCFVMLLTPLARPLQAFLLENTDLLLTGVLDEAAMAGMVEAMVPMLIGCGVLFAAVAIPLFYRLRLADYYLLDVPGCRARQAMALSRKALRRKCMALLRLDFHFWWFYLAEGVIAVIGYGDVLAGLLGLPLTGSGVYFGVSLLALAARLALYWFCRNRVAVTYVKFYQALVTPDL